MLRYSSREDIAVGFDSITRKRELGGALRAAREQARLSGPAAAASTGISQPTIWRIEAAQRPVSADQLALMASAYRVGEQELSRWLRMLQDIRERRWTSDFRPWMTTAYAQLIEVEQHAVEVRCLQLQVVPGLLQTPGYARALLSGSPLDLAPAQMEALMRVRIRRQRQLLGPDATLRGVFWLSEAVLDLRYGSAGVHRAQMRRLAELAGRRNISIGVIPYTRMVDMESADMYEMPDGAPVVYTESLHNPHVENRYPADICDRVGKMMLKAEQRSLSPAKTLASIRRRTN
jgi:transcriptional regulator with XRE-family HTH domain